MRLQRPRQAKCCLAAGWLALDTAPLLWSLILQTRLQQQKNNIPTDDGEGEVDDGGDADADADAHVDVEVDADADADDDDNDTVMRPDTV